MNDVIGARPEVTPVATCSSTAGVRRPQDESASTHTSPVAPTQSKRKRSTTLSQVQKQHEEVTERRHQERMERYDRFLELLQRIVDK